MEYEENGFHEKKLSEERWGLYRKTAKQFKLVVPVIMSVELQVSVKWLQPKC